MTRRQMLRRLAVLLGGAVSAPAVAAALSPRLAQEIAAEPWRPRTLDPGQHRLVVELAETILPATDTPGAVDAGVDRFVDLLLTDWFDDEERDRFLAGLAGVDAACAERFGAPFAELAAGERMAVLEPLDREAAEARRARGYERRGAGAEPLPFFATVKELTLVGYYTSEIGMRQELRYEEFPGSYAGCVPLAEIGRTWA